MSTTRNPRPGDDRPEFEEDPRYAQANREALWALGYWAAFTVVVTGLAWWLGYGRPAGELDFVLGFPAWFFWSVLVTSVVFSAIPPVIISRKFHDVPLTSDGEPTPGASSSDTGRS